MLRDRGLETRKAILSTVEMEGKRVLEIGCGNGRVTAMYARDAALVVGVEPDLSVLRGTVEALPEISFACASGMDLPFADNSFNVVLYTLSLHHHPDIAAALNEARRVASGNGFVLVLEPTVESEIQRLCKVFEDEDHRLAVVEQALPSCGMKISARRTFSTQWEFDGFDDVAEYAFTYYAHPPDMEKRRALRDFLGERSENVPLRMSDTLRLTCLRAY